MMSCTDIEISLVLIAMSEIIGGVVIQDDFSRWLVEAVHERINDHFVQPKDCLGIDPVFKA